MHKLTEESFREFMKDLSIPRQEEEPREWVAGSFTLKRMLDAGFELHIAKEFGQVTPEEYNNIKAMIDSSDKENLTVAEEIIKQKRKI
jgi:hypothetical protein